MNITLLKRKRTFHDYEDFNETIDFSYLYMKISSFVNKKDLRNTRRLIYMINNTVVNMLIKRM